MAKSAITFHYSLVFQDMLNSLNKVLIKKLSLNNLNRLHLQFYHLASVDLCETLLDCVPNSQHTPRGHLGKQLIFSLLFR